MVQVSLPAAFWTRSGSSTKPGYKYKDRQHVGGPITAVSVKDGKLSVKGSGAALYPLTGAPQGTLGLRFRLGTGFEFCAAAPAKSPSTSFDTTAKFTGARSSPPPAVCPAVP